MDTLKMKSLVIAGLLIGTSAFAQTQNPNAGSVNAQITMTRDYTQSLLTRIGSVPANRFNESSDYAVIGPRINARLQQALTEFRTAMETLMVGAFTDSIANYNETFNDTRLPDPEKQKNLQVQRQILDQQVKSVSVIYQGELKRLYQILPEMNITGFSFNGKKGYGNFASGSSAFFYEWGYRSDAKASTANWEYKYMSTYNAGYAPSGNADAAKMFRAQFDQYLKNVCKSRVCASGVLQQLTNYLLYVESYINRDLMITLADGSGIKIENLKGKIGSLPAQAVYETIPNFVFDATYTTLPLKL